MNVNKEYPHWSGLLIAVPHTGRYLPHQFTWAMLNCHPPMNCNVRYTNVTGCNVDVARNAIIKEAIHIKAKYVFFIDEDVIVPGHGLRQLWFTMEHHPEAIAAGGIYCHKSWPYAPMIFRGNGSGSYWDWKLGETFEVTGIAMGCTLVRVEPLAKMAEPWFFNKEDYSSFLDGIYAGERWSEDLYFCKKAVDAGWTILADANVICDHWDLEKNRPIGLPRNSHPMQPFKVKPGAKKIVDLGCGIPQTKYKTDEGEVIGVDIREECEADYRCDLRSMPFATGEFDVCYSSHTLEHFDKSEIRGVLKEWTRIMKPDGEMRLLLPDVEWAAKKIVAGEFDDHVGNVLYGGQSDPLNFHKFGFTETVIVKLLREQGFQWMRVVHPTDPTDYNMLIQASIVEPAFAAECQHKPLPPVEEETVPRVDMILASSLPSPDKIEDGVMVLGDHPTISLEDAVQVDVPRGHETLPASLELI